MSRNSSPPSLKVLKSNLYIINIQLYMAHNGFGTIVQIGDCLISEDVFAEFFCCDYALCKGKCGIVGDCSVEGFRERDLRFRLARLIDAPAEGGEVFNAPLARGDVDRLADAEEAGGGAAYYDRSDEYNGKEDEYDDGFCFR